MDGCEVRLKREREREKERNRHISIQHFFEYKDQKGCMWINNQIEWIPKYQKSNCVSDLASKQCDPISGISGSIINEYIPSLHWQCDRTSLLLMCTMILISFWMSGIVILSDITPYRFLTSLVFIHLWSDGGSIPWILPAPGLLEASLWGGEFVLVFLATEQKASRLTPYKFGYVKSTRTCSCSRCFEVELHNSLILHAALSMILWLWLWLFRDWPPTISLAHWHRTQRFPHRSP